MSHVVVAEGAADSTKTSGPALLRMQHKPCGLHTPHGQNNLPRPHSTRCSGHADRETLQALLIRTEIQICNRAVQAKLDPFRTKQTGGRSEERRVGPKC